MATLLETALGIGTKKERKKEREYTRKATIALHRLQRKRQRAMLGEHCPNQRRGWVDSQGMLHTSRKSAVRASVLGHVPFVRSEP